MNKNKISLNKIILTMIADFGIHGADKVEKGILKSINQFSKNKTQIYNLTYYIKKKIQRLEKNGLLKIISQNREKILSLTSNGQKLLFYYKSCEPLKKKTLKKWDGKWRIIIFDVWENTRRKRDIFRLQLKNFGFIQLQRSVWIYPYDCYDFFKFLKDSLSFDKNVRYILVDKLDEDEKLKKYFCLN